MTLVPAPKAPTATMQCSYDAWNRLTQVRNGIRVTRYEYDGLGRRTVSRDFFTRAYFKTVRGRRSSRLVGQTHETGAREIRSA